MSVVDNQLQQVESKQTLEVLTLESCEFICIHFSKYVLGRPPTLRVAHDVECKQWILLILGHRLCTIGVAYRRLKRTPVVPSPDEMTLSLVQRILRLSQ
eukprot:COSAG02_NODE_2429_length_8885_cov_3.820965_9_plen_99_part_00